MVIQIDVKGEGWQRLSRVECEGQGHTGGGAVHRKREDTAVEHRLGASVDHVSYATLRQLWKVPQRIRPRLVELMRITQLIYLR